MVPHEAVASRHARLGHRRFVVVPPPTCSCSAATDAAREVLLSWAGHRLPGRALGGAPAPDTSSRARRPARRPPGRPSRTIGVTTWCWTPVCAMQRTRTTGRRSTSASYLRRPRPVRRAAARRARQGGRPAVVRPDGDAVPDPRRSRMSSPCLTAIRAGQVPPILPTALTTPSRRRGASCVELWPACPSVRDPCTGRAPGQPQAGAAGSGAGTPTVGRPSETPAGAAGAGVRRSHASPDAGPPHARTGRRRPGGAGAA